MLNERELSAAIGGTAYDTEGEKIGTVEHFFVDDRTGAATWVAVTTGLFGTRHSVAPVGEATFADGALRLPVQKDAVRHAPHVTDTAHLDADTETELRRHYGVSGTAGGGTSAPSGGPVGPGPDDVRTPPPDLPPGAQPPAPTAQPPAAEQPPAADQPRAAEGTPALGGTASADGTPTGRHAARENGEETGRTWSPTDTGLVPVGAVGGGTDEPPGPVAVPAAEVAAARSTGTPEDGSMPDDASMPDDGSMLRHEEQLSVSHERVPVARVRLVKYVVTEEVQVTVPVRREEVRIEQLPVGEGASGTHGGTGVGIDSGTDGSWDGGPGESLLPPGAEPAGGLPDEIVLHAERPVVSVEVVPVERVRLHTEDVAGTEQVSAQLMRERIVLDET